MIEKQKSSGRKRAYTATTALLAALLALLLLLASGYGYRWQWWPLGTAFAMLRWGGYLGAAAFALGAMAAVLMLRRRAGKVSAFAVTAMIAGAVAFALPYQWLQKARSVPPIHDISTDVSDPPAFVSIVPLRQAAPNPVSYDYQQNAEAQQQAYPDIQTLRLQAPPQRVFDSIEAAIQTLGWELVDSNPEEGRLEATDTTRWFGFKDDVVVRVRARGEHTLVDIRSKSRVGKSDVGTNANRIRALRATLISNL